MVASEDRFRVAIIGGGIGGLFAALAIRYNCKDLPVDIDVYEQASEFKEIGAGVGLAVNSARMVHNVGLGERLNAIAGYRSGIWIDFRRFDNGESIIAIPTDDTKTIRQAPCARTDLLDLFRHAIEERNAANLHTRKKFASVEDNGDHVTIHFEDSTSATASVVVGCDGIHSSVRNQFVDDRPVYSGQIAYRATIPISEIQEWWPYKTYSVMWCGRFKHFLTFPISCNRTLNVVAFADASGKDAEKVAESWVSTCDRKEVEVDYELFEPIVQRLISLMPEQPSKWRINDREPLDRWSYMDGKVILLGDAAHAMLPHAGAGAGQAVEDGWILGRILSEYVGKARSKALPTLQARTTLYQKVRLPRAQKVQATSRASGPLYGMKSPSLIDKAFDECVPIVADTLRDRMKFIWEAELDKAYEDARASFETVSNGANH